jgi:hypothetical protein
MLKMWFFEHVHFPFIIMSEEEEREEKEDPFTHKPDSPHNPEEDVGYYILHYGLDGAQSGPKETALQFFTRGGEVILPSGQTIVFQAVKGDYKRFLPDYLKVVAPHALQLDIVQAFKIVHYMLDECMHQRYLSLQQGLSNPTFSWNGVRPEKSTQELCAFNSDTHTHGLTGCRKCEKIGFFIN